MGDDKDKDLVEGNRRSENRPKRITLSARATTGLQNTGMKDIVDDVADQRISKPKVYGLPRHYNVSNVWGATNAHHHTMMGTRPPGDPAVDMGPVCFTQIFKAANTAKGKKTKGVVYQCNLSKYSHVLRTSDCIIWPKTNSKMVVSVKSAPVMVTSEPIVDLLIAKGTLPLIKHPRPRREDEGNEKSFMEIPFGPYLDQETDQPLLPGKCRLASSIYSRYGMKLLSGHNEAWKAGACAASGLFVRLPEKNGLPVDGCETQRLSPLAEIQRISSGSERMGFIVHRSGGNCTMKGQAPPAEAARTAGEGAFFEHAQSIKNPYNFAIEILVEQGTPVAVWGAGDLVPARFRDRDLARDTDGAEQVYYFGCYKIERSTSQPAKTREELLEVVEEYQEEYPKLTYLNLRFLLQKQHSYALVPVEYPALKAGYHYLPVDLRDNRRPMFEVAGSQSFEAALGEDNDTCFNETSMLTAWFRSGGCNEYSNHPFLPRAGKKRKAVGDDNGWFVENESAFRLLTAPQEGTHIAAPTLAQFETRSQTLRGQWDVVLNCSIASFSRLLELNVDRAGKVGPLLDSNPKYHKGESSLDNYLRLFGDSKSGVERLYLKQLSPVSVQKSASTAAIRTYDAGKILLMLGNGGCNKRLERNGLDFVSDNLDTVADMILQCLLVEVVRVPILMEWSEMKQKRDGTTGVYLPTLREVDSFIDFLADVMSVNKFQTTGHLLQTQYEIHCGFASLKAFAKLLKFLRDKLRDGWLTLMLSGARRTKGKAHIDMFDISRNTLATLLSQTETLGSWNDEKMQFFTQHILMNVNELVNDWPFRIPGEVVLGFGGKFGAKRLARGAVLGFGSKFGHSVPHVFALQLTEVRETYSNRDLTMMGLERLEGTSVVVVSVNQRPICTIEIEHFGCLDMISSEREMGGSRGSSNRYDVTSPHCHPVPNACYYAHSKAINAVAVAAMKEHKDRVDQMKPGKAE